MQDIRVRVPAKIGELFAPTHHPVTGKRIRSRGAKGGRGSAKSTGFAQMAIIRKIQRPGNFLCCRELQKSIKDSVYSLLREQMYNMGANECFDIGETFIRSKLHPDTQFLFNGLRTNPQEIKSMNRLDCAWIEEAQAVSQRSLDLLYPTVRMDESEIWSTWNPEDELDPIEQKLVANPPEDALVIEINYSDNPFFPDVLEQERLNTLRFQPQRYDWMWLGKYNTNTDGAVYGKWVAQMERDGRIKKGIFDPSLPVFTAWDLGFSDDTAIWWFQVAGNEVRLIDYYENNREGVRHYAEQVYGREIINIIYGPNGKVLNFTLGNMIDGIERRLEYQYADHYVPHDAANKLLQAGGRSVVDQLFEFGIKTKVVHATSQQNQIEAARLTLEKTWADPEICKDGIRALRKYQFLFDENRNKYMDKPDHDSYSHGCDAYEIIAQVWKSAKVEAAPAAPRFLADMTVNEVFYGEVNNGGYERI